MSDRQLFFVSTRVCARELRTLCGSYSRPKDRICLAQWQRWLLLEPVSEALTLVFGGLILLLAFAVPTIRAPLQEDPLKASNVAACLFDRYCNPIGGRQIDHRLVPLEDFPDAVIKVTLATEDRHFYDHLDLDLPGALHTLLTRMQNDRVHQDGSSITRQLARTLLSNTGPGVGQKIKEVFLAVWLEWHLTKDEILGLYLNYVDMGGDALGVDGAARFYFNKPVRDLNLAEAAMLVGLIKVPTTYVPHLDLATAQARANVVLDNLVEAGFMTEDQVLRARSDAARLVVRGKTTSPN
ncbi:transglycosylase domain-containing protein [Bradyrhizobium sp. UFLA05-109]